MREGVEGEGGQEAAPARRGALARPRGVRVVVGGGVPAVGGYFGDGVDAGDDIGPVAARVGRPGIAAGHADDGDVQRRGILAQAPVPVSGGWRELGCP